MSTAPARRQKTSPELAASAVPVLADVQVASSELTRDINRDVVLGRIRALQPISRVDLARASGLQPSTVSSIVEQLLQEGWIREGAVVKTARGRRPTLISLNDDFVILAADVRPAHAVVALLDLNGRFLERQLVPLGKDPVAGVAAIARAMKAFRDQHARKTLSGVGVSMPGRVDADTNRLVFAPNLHWLGFDIAGSLRAALGVDVQMENAANASMLSEIWFGRMDGVRHAVLVTISEGIGAAILADGRLLCGQQGLAGEFGHICVDPEGPVCGCGARGCWEVFASSRAAQRYYAELKPDGERKMMLELVSMAVDGDKAASKALEKQAIAIGRGLHMLNAVLAPDVILLVGDITLSTEMYRNLIEAECKAGVMAGESPALLFIGDGEVARLRGAAAVALQRNSRFYRAAKDRLSNV